MPTFLAAIGKNRVLRSNVKLVFDRPTLDSRYFGESASDATFCPSLCPPGKQPRRAVAEGPRLEAEGGWVVHRRSQILHRVYREKVLLCGRPRTKAYEVVEDITRVGNLVCKTCERNAS